MICKKILVIGGGKWQVPIVKKIKSLGHKVVCTNLYADSPAFAYADISYVVNILDKEKNLEIAKRHQVDAVVSDQTDIAVKTVAYLNEKLGLYGVGIENAELFTNKYQMRQYLQVEGLSHPRYKICENMEDVREFYTLIQAPLMLKPLANQSSRGLYYLESISEVEQACAFTLSHSTHGKFLAEEFIGGIELTVEGYKFLNGEHKTLAISKKKYFEGKIGIANELFYAPEFDFFSCDSLKNINNTLFKNIPFAITHVEYKFYNGKFYLIEAALRGGGTKISSLIIPALSGCDVNDCLIQNALGDDTVVPVYRGEKSYAVLKFFNFKQGVVREIKGRETITKNSNVLDFDLEFNVGDKLEAPKDDRSRAGYYIATTDRYEDLIGTMKEVENSIEVLYEDAH